MPVFSLDPYHVGKRTFHPILLAPLSGVTDYPFRKIVRDASSLLQEERSHDLTLAPTLACLTFSEMVASRSVIAEMKDSRKLELGAGDQEGMVVQLAGTSAQICAEAAKILEQKGAIGIDLNFGCPARKVVKKAAGSSLMRDEALCINIFNAVVKAVTVPVSVKMRLGWDYASINAPEIARQAELAGIRVVTVHGRTRCQFYSGQADWAGIAAVKQAVSVPVVVNGDIGSFRDAQTALEKSKADFVMIGRAAIGQPWILGDIARLFDKSAENRVINGTINGAMEKSLISGQMPERHSSRQKVDFIFEHFEMSLVRYGAVTGIRTMRKHFLGYARALIADEQRRNEFFQAMLGTREPGHLFILLKRYFLDEDNEGQDNGSQDSGSRDNISE